MTNTYNNEPPLSSENKEWYTKAEVMKLLGTSSSTVYQYYKRNIIKKIEDPHRLFKEARYNKKEVDELVAKKLEHESDMEGLSPSQVAENLGISQQSVYKYIRDGIIEAKTIPFGDEREAYKISLEAQEELASFLLETESTKARKSEYYDPKRDIALFQKFTSTDNVNARVVRGTKNEWQFLLLASDERIDYAAGIERYQLRPVYGLHQEPLKDMGYSVVSIPKQHHHFYQLVDYLYTTWGIENVRLREKDTNVEIFVQAGHQPFTNVDFSLNSIFSFVIKGKWILQDSNLIVQSAYKRTSLELPTDMIDEIKKLADEQHLTMSQCMEKLLSKRLDDIRAERIMQHNDSESSTEPARIT